MTPQSARLPRALAPLAVLALAGCVAVTPENAADPYQDFNRSMFEFNQGFDRAVLQPVSQGYVAITNEPIREGVGNFTSNLGEPVTMVNHVLQGKLPDAGATFGRFVINTTVGLAGIFDPAAALGIQRTKEDFGQTLGVWGVPAGPYLVLPFMGSTTPRDIFGRGGDAMLNPLNYPEFENDDEIRLGVALLGGIHARAQAQGAIEELRNQVDPYTTVRRLYGRTRAADIGIPYEEPNQDEDLPEGELDF